MRQSGCARWLAASLTAALVSLTQSGCADNSMVLKGQMAQFQQQQMAVAAQNQQLQQRANSLDRDNQELEALLAQARQQHKLTEEELAGVRSQLRGTTTQLAAVRAEKDEREQQFQTLTTSMRRRGGVSISPNNSLLQILPTLDLPPGSIRRDGDVIRVSLPGNRLFESGSARLRPGAVQLIGEAAAELRRIYPDQFLGIEGHTDSDRISGRQWRSNHELSVGRAMAIYGVLVHQAGYSPTQLFVVGHGPNPPLHSNAPPAGKEGNRRVELVVYPEKTG